jgi:hypothetical protein
VTVSETYYRRDSSEDLDGDDEVVTEFDEIEDTDVDEDDDREPTQVTRLLDDMREKIAKHDQAMDQISQKAAHVGRVARRPRSYPALKIAISQPPPPPNDDVDKR